MNPYSSEHFLIALGSVFVAIHVKLLFAKIKLTGTSKNFLHNSIFPILYLWF